MTGNLVEDILFIIRKITILVKIEIKNRRHIYEILTENKHHKNCR